MTPIEQAIEALTRCTPYMYKSAPIEKYVAHCTVIAELRAQPARVPVALNRDDTEHGVYYYKASEVDALLRAQPAEPFKKLSDNEVLWIAERHGIDVYASNPLGFYNDLISTTPAQPDHSELVRRLRHTASKGVSVWGDLMIEAADALEGI